MMWRPQSDRLRGRLDGLQHDSVVLAGNRLNDPTLRHHPVYLPPGYDDPDHAALRYPVLWSLAAYTSAGPAQVAWRNHGETLPQRLDRLITSGAMPPAVVVFPDCYTSLGGNQYVNSEAIGNYAEYLAHELVPAIDARYRTLATPASRGVFGKSSGGFGALHLVMQYPEVWSAAASHAGDVGFDRVYVRDFPLCCDVLSRCGGDVEAFVRSFWRSERPRHDDFHALMVLCLAASYSPDPNQPLGLALPFDLRTCALDETIWARWLSFDPLHQVHAHQQTLQRLRGLWIDVGSRDQYYIHYGSRALHDALLTLNVDHHWEEFDGSHSGIDWRYDHSLPWLLQRLATA